MQTILIMDDEPVELDRLRTILEDDDYRFETASSGAEVREITQDRGTEIAAILMDWVLPDEDGIALLGWIKSQPILADLEVVVHSADFGAENIRKAIECGAYYFLTKPFEEEQLEAIMRAAIGSCHLKRRLAEKVEESKGVFRLLEHGVFNVRKIREAELIAVQIASGIDLPDSSMGLLELLVNAVEHGNLGISYEEKGRLLAEGRLVAERSRRLGLPEYRDRRAEVRVGRIGGALEVTIQDEGSGFDFERYMKLDKARLFDAHGRGVMLASATLELRYTPPGNQVTVRLPLGNENR